MNINGTMVRRYHQGLIGTVTERYAKQAVIAYCKVNPIRVDMKIGFLPNLSDQGPTKKLHNAGTTFMKTLVTIRMSAEYFSASTSRACILLVSFEVPKYLQTERSSCKLYTHI